MKMGGRERSRRGGNKRRRTFEIVFEEAVDGLS